MKVWKVEEFKGGYAPHFLEEKLNELQKAGKEIKSIYPLVSYGFTRAVQIVYTEEDTVEE